MSEHTLLALSLPLLLALLAICWLIIRISRYSNFRFSVRGLGISVEIVSKEKEPLGDGIASGGD